MNVEFPDQTVLKSANELTFEDYPEFAIAKRHQDLDPITDIPGAVTEAVRALNLDGLARGASIGITVGSRGIADMPELVRALGTALRRRDYEPVIIPAMGSHGGATANGQKETLAALGFTEESMDCPIQSSMDVTVIGTDDAGRDILVSTDAMEADGIVIVNRIKPHTDFRGPVESGLSKMAVVGLGKHKGAESLHNAGLADDFSQVIQDRAARIIEAAPVIGGIGLIEDAEEQATIIEGMPADDILDREAALIERAYEELPMLPVDALDILIVDEIGKEISGTGMDTNILGRYRFHGEAEPDRPQITRVYARSLTPASHGNALGVGLADFIHRDLLEDIDFQDMYINIVTSGEPERAKIPLVVPDDRTALQLLPSTVGIEPEDLADLRVARIKNTLETDLLQVSAPVATELENMENITVGPCRPLKFNERGNLPVFDDSERS